MFMIPESPSYRGTLPEWEDYRRKVDGFPIDEPGRSGAMAEADGMIAAIKEESDGRGLMAA